MKLKLVPIAAFVLGFLFFLNAAVTQQKITNLIKLECKQIQKIGHQFG